MKKSVYKISHLFFLLTAAAAPTLGIFVMYGAEFPMMWKDVESDNCTIGEIGI